MKRAKSSTGNIPQEADRDSVQRTSTCMPTVCSHLHLGPWQSWSKLRSTKRVLRFSICSVKGDNMVDVWPTDRLEAIFAIQNPERIRNLQSSQGKRHSSFTYQTSLNVGARDFLNCLDWELVMVELQLAEYSPN